VQDWLVTAIEAHIEELKFHNWESAIYHI